MFSFVWAVLSHEFVLAGHRRLVEYLRDPGCPSIRRFAKSFGGTPSAGNDESGPVDAETYDQHTASGDRGVLPTNASGSSACTGCHVEEGNRNEEEEEDMSTALKEAYNGCLGALQEFR